MKKQSALGFRSAGCFSVARMPCFNGIHGVAPPYPRRDGLRHRIPRQRKKAACTSTHPKCRLLFHCRENTVCRTVSAVAMHRHMGSQTAVDWCDSSSRNTSEVSAMFCAKPKKTAAPINAAKPNGTGGNR